MHKWIRFLVWTVLILGAVVGLARLTALRWWRVPTMEEDPDLVASLSPALRGGDLVILWRLTRPAYGALVVCRDPEDASRVVIGRIVAEENDRISVDGVDYTVNDQKCATERACYPSAFESEHPATGQRHVQHCQIEVMRGHTHMRGSLSQDLPAPRTDSVEVPAGDVYLLSDNRMLPYDSRDYGTVERSNCTEAIIFRLVGAEGYSDSESRFTFIR